MSLTDTLCIAPIRGSVVEKEITRASKTIQSSGQSFRTGKRWKSITIKTKTPKSHVDICDKKKKDLL